MYLHRYLVVAWLVCISSTNSCEEKGLMLRVDAVVVDRFYIVLFSALAQIHCALVPCDSKRVTSFLFRVLTIHRSGVRTALFGCYVAGATRNCYHLRAFCVHHTTLHPNSKQRFTTSFLQWCSECAMRHVASLPAKPQT